MIKKITFKYIWQLLLKKKKHLILGQFITIIAILISIPIPLIIPQLVDELLLHKPGFFVNNINHLFGDGTIFYYVLIVIISTLILRIFYFISTSIMTKFFTSIGKYVTFKIREKLLNHLKIVSMNEYETLGSGAIGAKLITDVDTLDNFIMTSSKDLVAAVLTLLAVSIVITTIHPILGLMILTIQPLVIFFSKKIAKKVGDLKKEENSAVETFQENVGEVLELFGQIKASSKEKTFFNDTIKKAKDVQITSNKFNYKNIVYQNLSFTIFVIAFDILRACALLMVVYSNLSIGMMLAMTSYIWFVITPIHDILSIQYSYSQAKAAINRINEILLLKTEATSNKLLESKDLHIKTKNLYFRYNKDKDILKNISINIKNKEKVALIGASGSGKTTLAQVLASFYEKNKGELTYNTIQIEQLNKESLRKAIFLILQMPILFNKSLRFNIAMENENITDKQLYEALKIAQLEDTIKKMPKGLDTIVGRHGIRLSGGQRQRISIARMIIANPKVIIFDESTSALDVQTEINLFEALKPILKDKTVITIAHRLSTIKNADKIYVLNEGQIVQQGTHDELENKEGHYLEFVKKQLI